MYRYQRNFSTYLFKVALSIIVTCVITCHTSLAEQPTRYNIEDVVDIKDINDRILVKLAYSTTENFLHEDVYGDIETCYLRKEAAEKLDKAQTLLEKKRKGYRLVVYDGLRPRDVQYKMWRSVKGTPQQGYVADPEKGSFHNYGAAVDVSIIDDTGNPLDMGTPFDYFGDLAQPRYEERFLKEGKLTKKQLENRNLLREVMQKAGFQGIVDEWWHFNAFSYEEVKRRYPLVEFLLPHSKIKEVLKEVEGLKRDKNGFCIFVKGSERKLYLIEQNEIKLVFDSAVGERGLDKKREGDHKTPLGDYRIKWMVSKNGPPKKNPGGVSSFVVDGQTYAVLDTELYFGNLKKIRVKVFPDGTRKVSHDVNDRPITPLEIRIAQSERLWTDAYGGENAYVMALDYPNPKDRAEGKTGSCIEIHASLKLEKEGYKNYTGTLGCIAMYPDYAKRVYEYVNPGTPVRIVE